MLRLRREVELPVRLHERAWLYVGLASFLLSVSIIVDAVLWTGPTMRAERAERAATIRRLHQLRAPCAVRKPVPPPVPSSRWAELHDDLMRQLEHPWAVAEQLDAPTRYGKIHQGGGHGAAAPRSPAVRTTRQAGVPVAR